MGIVGKVLKGAYRYIRYGKQIGKTAKNGNQVYKRGATTTGLDKDGNVIRQVRTRKTGPYTTTTESYTPIPFSKDYKYSQRIKTETEKTTETDIFRCRKSPDGSQSDIYDTPWSIDYSKNRKTGKITGVKDSYIDNGRYSKRVKFGN